MTDDLPTPPVPATADLRELTWMPLDVVRLRDSDLVATPNAEAFRVAVMSWCVSWHQVPAASLPDDDATLARLLGFGRDLRGWKKAREAGGLRGWVKHSDGRLYHPVVVEKALEAMAQQARSKAKREQDAERLRKWRRERDGNDGETHFVAERPDHTIPNQTVPDQTRPDHNTPPSPSAPTRDPATATAKLSRRVQAVDWEAVRKALESENSLAVLAAFGANMERPEAEWRRDAGGLQIGVLAGILAWRNHQGQRVREPSGLRKAREEWAALSRETRKTWYDDMVSLLAEGVAK